MLTVVQIRVLKPAARPFKVFDSEGLFLLVQPSWALLWRFRYRKFGIERKLSLGCFPDVTLQQARKEPVVSATSGQDAGSDIATKRNQTGKRRHH